MTAKLHESSTLSATGTKRRIRLISEGQGSSGLYSGAMLERDGALAFPAGTHIYLDHLTEDEDDARSGSHSIKDLVGATLADATFEEGALNTDAVFFSNWAPLIEEMREYIDLSIEAAGSVREGVVESLHPSPMNAVSIVPRGGRDGKILELIESYRESGKIDNVKPDADKVREDARKDKGMTPEEIAAFKQAVVEAVATAVAAGLVEIKESLAPVKPEEDKTEAPSAAEVAEALVVSGLPTEARTRVYETLKTNPDYAAAIEAEKTYVDSIKESLKVEDKDDDSFVRESAKTDKNTYRVGGWA